MWLVLLFALASHRIVSTAPSVTEILFALGAGDQVVGDTLYCNYPEAAKSKPKIGGYATPNIELILALNPDLVFVNELIELAGGVNAATDVVVQYPRFSFEEVIRRDPDIILDMGHDHIVTESERQVVKQVWRKYLFLRAVRHDAVFPISGEYFVTPGPRVGEAVRELRRIFSR